MAICDVCKQEMTEGGGCKATVVLIGGFGFPRSRDHDESDDGRCHDCGAVHGELHHPGCDMERCPVCNGQLISCGCLDADIHVEEI
jgi:hypothetical protein